MKKTKEEGVTLVALVTTIIVLLIISSIGVTAGTSAINYAKFLDFKEELKIIQTKVNELNYDNEIDIGQELTNEQKKILNIQEVSNVIYNGMQDEEIAKMQNKFRYFNNSSLKNNLQLESIKRDYLINFEYRYVICCEGFTYDNQVYYMIDQIDGELYNVRYQNKNENSGDYKFEIIKESDRWKIQVTDIEYNGYISNWQLNYKFGDDESWHIANGLSFYVTKPGNYYIKLSHGEEINLGSKLVSIIDETNNLNNNIQDENVM